MTGRQMVKEYRDNGWELDRINGSHHIMKKVSIPNPYRSMETKN